MPKKKNKKQKEKTETLRQQHEAEAAPPAKIGYDRSDDRATIGIIKKIQLDRSYNNLIEAIILYRVKENKTYKQDGLTWDEYCNEIGRERRTIDNILNDIKPIYLNFSEMISDFCGIEFNKIRLLGRSISENVSEIKGDALLYDGEEIPITPEHKNDIIAVIERIQDGYNKKLAEQKKQAEKELNEKEKNIHILKTDNDYMKEMLKEFEELVPDRKDKPKMDRAMALAEGYYMKFESVIEYIKCEALDLEDGGGIAAMESLLQKMYSRIMHKIDQVQKYKKGEGLS